MVFNSPSPSLNHMSVNGIIIEQVDTLKYLGLTYNKFTFEHHIMDIHKRSQQRLHVLHTLSALHATPHLLLLLYKSIIQSILLYCSSCFYTMLSVSNRNKLLRITHIASKIVRSPTPNISELNSEAIARLARSIVSDTEHSS